MNLIWERIAGGNVLLVAPRRFGKTSVMYGLIDHPREEFKVVHSDLEAVNSASDFIVHLVEAASKDEKLGVLVNSLQFISSVWSTLSGKIEEVGLYAVKLKLKETIEKDWQEKGKAILQRIAESESKTIFVLDEFPMMLDAMIRSGKEEEAKLLLRWFRSLRLSPEIQEKVRFLIAGSIGIDRILAKLNEESSINDFEKMKLAPFAQGTAQAFLTNLADTHQIELSEKVKNKIIELVGAGVPYFIQVIFSEIYKHIFEEGAVISEELVEVVYREKVLGVDCKTYFEHYYGRLRIYYEATEEKAARLMLREIAIAGRLSRDTCFQIFRSVIGESADLEQFGCLMAELENDFYINSLGSQPSYEFGSKLLRDWWLRHYGMSVD